MSDLFVIGVDPGQTTGVVGVPFVDGRAVGEGAFVVQTTSGLVLDVIGRLVHLAGSAAVHIAVEKFVVGPRASRSGTPAAGRTARELIAAIHREYAPVERPAVEVKRWATDKRLDAAGLLDPTKGMGHARDAARHALFAAVRDGRVPDPLSRKATR
ncbi:hypothetical protein BAY59_10850 [Prauserella coralliicola]|nr:hypothetical protein BAY59_10850 [Prauserella coralliicola]